MAVSTDEKVVSLDGDGSLLMNLGTIATIGREQPQKPGGGGVGQPKNGPRRATSPATRPSAPTWSRWRKAAASPAPPRSSNLEDLEAVFCEALEQDGPWFIVAKIEETEYMPVAPR